MAGQRVTRPDGAGRSGRAPDTAGVSGRRSQQARGVYVGRKVARTSGSAGSGPGQPGASPTPLCRGLCLTLCARFSGSRECRSPWWWKRRLVAGTSAGVALWSPASARRPAGGRAHPSLQAPGSSLLGSSWRSRGSERRVLTALSPRCRQLSTTPVRRPTSSVATGTASPGAGPATGTWTARTAPTRTPPAAVSMHASPSCVSLASTTQGEAGHEHCPAVPGRPR